MAKVNTFNYQSPEANQTFATLKVGTWFRSASPTRKESPSLYIKLNGFEAFHVQSGDVVKSVTKIPVVPVTVDVTFQDAQ